MDSSPAVVPEAPVNSSEAPKEEDPLKSSDVEMKEATMEPVEKSTDQEEPAQGNTSIGPIYILIFLRLTRISQRQSNPMAEPSIQ